MAEPSPVRSPLAGVILAALASACGPLSAERDVPSAAEALGEDPERLATLSPARLAALWTQARERSAAQANAARPDAGALFAVERGGALVSVRLPPAARLTAGAPVAVDLDGSGDPFGSAPSPSLRGLSEREAAERVASALASAAGGAVRQPIPVERAEGAPYAAALVAGTLWLNPSLLVLAFADPAEGRAQPPGARPQGLPPSSCGGAAPGTLLALAWALRRVARTRPA